MSMTAKTLSSVVSTALTVGLVLAGGFALRGSDAQPLSGDSVVASVNGEHILYTAIKVTTETAKQRFRSTHRHDPMSTAEEREVEEARVASELSRCRSRIRAVIVRQKLSELGADPTPEEIAGRVEIIEHDVDVPKVVGESRVALRAVLAALDEVAENGSDPDAVYAERLIGKLSAEEWQLRVRYESSPERRNLLRRVLELPDSELFNVEDTARSVLATEKSRQAVEAAIIATDPEYAEYVHLAATEPSNPKVQEKSPMYRDAKRYEWWQARYREAKVEIKDERFKDAWQPKTNE
jgi:hypothetical protein